MAQRNCSWEPPEFAPDDAASVEAAWRAWVTHEMTKRTLFLSYMHDMIQLISFALPACYTRADFTMHLPCDDALWDARSAPEWLAELQRASPYGTVPDAPEAEMRDGMRRRLKGLYMPDTLDVLRNARACAEDRARVAGLALAPMASYMIMKVLGPIFAVRT